MFQHPEMGSSGTFGALACTMGKIDFLFGVTDSFQGQTSQCLFKL